MAEQEPAKHMKATVVALVLILCGTVPADQKDPAEPKPSQGVASILKTVPADVFPAPKKQWAQVKADLANDALKDAVTAS